MGDLNGAAPDHRTEERPGTRCSIGHEPDKAVDFLQKWKPGGPWVLTAIPADKKGIETRTFDAEQEGELRKWLDRQHSRRWNVYFSVNSTLRKLDKKAEKTDIASMAWLHVDVDPEPGQDFEQEQRRILKTLQGYRGLPKPTVILYSGGGYWAFWKLAEPIEINGQEAAWIEAERYNRQIEIELRGDNCHNIDRIARLPGTVNWPDEKKRRKGQVPALAKVEFENWEGVYTPAEFEKAQPAVAAGGGNTGTEVTIDPGSVPRITGELDDVLPAGVTERCKTVIMQGSDPDQPLNSDDQSRSPWVLYVCCELVRHKVDDETIYAILMEPTFGISKHVREQGGPKQVHRYALRQIERAKERVIHPALQEKNDEYAYVESIGGRARVMRTFWDEALEQEDIEFLLVNDFKTTHSNRKVETPNGVDKNGNPKPPTLTPEGKWWIEHPHRRTYKTVTFAPNKDVGEDTFNMWTGFGYDPVQGDCGLYLAHLKDNVCRGDEECFDYLIRWMAHAVKNPGDPGEVGVVIRGEKGTGKNETARHFGMLFGRHYKEVTNPEHVMGKFNATLKDAVVIVADECFAPTNKAHEAALKAAITSRRVQVEMKGVDAQQRRNCTHLILLTNDDWAVPATRDERRFFVLDIGTAQQRNREYFGAIDRQMRDGGYQALLHFLLTYDLSGFDVTAVPHTTALDEQKGHTIEGTLEGMWLEALRTGEIVGGQPQPNRCVLVSGKALIEAWMPSLRRKPSKKALAALLDKPPTNRGDRGMEFDRERLDGGRGPRGYLLPTLKECRERWDERRWPVEWDDDVTDWVVLTEDGEHAMPQEF